MIRDPQENFQKSVSSVMNSKYKIVFMSILIIYLMLFYYVKSKENITFR